MKLFTTYLLSLLILGFFSNTKATCTCDQTEPFKCECKACNCANED